MRKIVVIVLVVMLIASLAVPAFAANIVPISKIGIKFKMPTIKTVDVSYSTVYESAKVAIRSNIINTLYKAYSFGR